MRFWSGGKMKYADLNIRLKNQAKTEAFLYHICILGGLGGRLGLERRLRFRLYNQLREVK